MLKKIKKYATNLSLVRPPVSVLFEGREPSDTVLVLVKILLDYNTQKKKILLKTKKNALLQVIEAFPEEDLADGVLTY